jgi:protein SCO1/2
MRYLLSTNKNYIQKSQSFFIHNNGKCSKYFSVFKRQLSSQSNTDSSSFRGPITYASLTLMFLVSTGVAFYYSTEKENKIKSVTSEVVHVGKPSLGGPFVLVNQDGVPVTDASFKGKFCLLYFGFTYCPDICPSELVKVGSIVNALGNFTFI